MNSERGSGDVLEYEAKLWSMANEMRGNMDAAEYKHVALGLVFLKYISDGLRSIAPRSSRSAIRSTAAYARTTATSTSRTTFSGCRTRRAGGVCEPPRAAPTSARWSMTP